MGNFWDRLLEKYRQDQLEQGLGAESGVNAWGQPLLIGHKTNLAAPSVDLLRRRQAILEGKIIDPLRNARLGPVPNPFMHLPLDPDKNIPPIEAELTRRKVKY
jgi:hypothetical protein